MVIKKSVIFLILTLMLLSTSFPIYASSNSNEDYINLNGGSAEDIAINERNKEAIIQEWSNTPMLTGYTSYKLSVNTYQQETSYWCKPANIKQVVQFINGSSTSQSTYASSMGTNSTDGTYVYKMANELNKRQTKFTYAYQYISSSTTSDSFLDTVQRDIILDKPMILHADTKYVPLYNGVSLGHYLTLSGIGLDFTAPGTQSPPIVYYVDPYYADYGKGSVLGSHNMKLTAALNCVSDRYIIY